MGIFAIEGVTMPYAWGARDLLAEFLGRPASGGPEAELWIGAHPAGPARLIPPAPAADLAALIEAQPERILGQEVHARFGRLPFLLKILAIDAPLSLQTHPDGEQARRGFAAEEEAGKPRDAPDRNYRDDSHKPELLLALSEVEALCGFRQPEQRAEILRRLELKPWLDAAPARADEAAEMEALFRAVFALDAQQRKTAIAHVARAIDTGALAGESDFEATAKWFITAREHFSDDAGLLALLFLRHVSLAPGQALYLPARRLHAYLCGMGVELMASSDNVLRAGLTPKHVDVEELCRVLDFDSAVPAVQTGEPLVSAHGASQTLYRTPSPEFALARMEIDGGRLSLRGPALVLADRGEITLTEESSRAGNPDPPTTLRQGGQAICAGDSDYRVSGRGSLFVATVGAPATGG